jgi:hypothetical protein
LLNCPCVKLLIIAGPYEADRIRKAAATAGFEAVTVEPGESLAVWITAIHPDAIVVVPQAVSSDPAFILAEVRTVPRGQGVPVFLVGDAEEELHLRPLANGFLARPVTPEQLRKSVLEVTGRDGTAATPPSGASSPGTPGAPTLDALGERIEADFDDEIRDAVRAVGVLRQATSTLRSSLTGVRGEAVRPPSAEPARASVATSAEPALASAALPSRYEVELDLPSLLARMFLSRLSGRLTLTHGNATKHILFENGHPIVAGSTLPEDRMGEMLVRQGRFSAEQISACAGEVTSGRRLGVVLVDRGLMKATELDPLVRHHYEDVMYSLFSWDRGAWTLATDTSASTENILLSQHPAALILEGIRRAYSAERALAGLGGANRVLRLRLTTGSSDLLENMAISPEERNLILLFDGLRGLDEIRSLTGAPPERLYGVAWALYVLDRLDAVDGPARDLSGPSRSRSTLSNHERDRARDHALVESRHALVVDGDYFQILSVPRDASAAQIRRAYEVRIAELAPEHLHPAVAAEWESELVEMRAVLAEAARLLADEGLRLRYRDHLPPAPAPPAPDAAPAASLAPSRSAAAGGATS